MKRLMCMAVLAISFFQMQAFTPVDDSFIAKSAEIQPKVLNLQLANLQENYTQIEITNLDADVVYYTEFVKDRNGYNKNIDLKNLNDGRYLLTVKSDGETTSQVLKIKEGKMMTSRFSD